MQSCPARHTYSFPKAEWTEAFAGEERTAQEAERGQGTECSLLQDRLSPPLALAGRKPEQGRGIAAALLEHMEGASSVMRVLAGAIPAQTKLPSVGLLAARAAAGLIRVNSKEQTSRVIQLESWPLLTISVSTWDGCKTRTEQSCQHSRGNVYSQPHTHQPGPLSSALCAQPTNDTGGIGRRKEQSSSN